MNQYPMWKNMLIIAVIVLGGLFAFPNLYKSDDAIQISAGRQGTVDLAFVAKVEEALKTKSIAFKRAELENDQLVIRFADADTQLKAQEVLQVANLGDYIIALNLAPTTPSWLAALGAKPMSLGLDLRGGVHLLIEVDMASAEKKALEGYAGDLRDLFKQEKIRNKRIQIEVDKLTVGFRSVEYRDLAESKVGREFDQLIVKATEEGTTPSLTVSLNEVAKREVRSFALQQNIITLRNRINELGVAEPTVQQQGDSRIVVQLPGIRDSASAKKLLGSTATLEFRMVDYEHDAQDAVNSGRAPTGSKLYHHRDGRPFLLENRVMLSGERIINAVSMLDQQSGSPAVSITLDGKGASQMSNATAGNIGNPMAVVFIESEIVTREIDGEIVKTSREKPEVINVATIRAQLSKKFQITGLDSPEEAYELALLLRAGALAAPIEIVEERTVGPSLGQDNIDQGFNSVMIGFVFVLIFMAIWYRVFGLVANLALALNLVLIVALLSLLQATLTLPGIAGIVLTVGMAVDANVLIFERIREELRAGNSPQTSIHAGYAKAFSTIADANITTLIAAIVLFGFGTGAIKGFAVTLIFGIATSMFTSIVGTRAIINLIYGKKQKPKLSI
ncbi:MAG: protein translocase subunit SecD [Methylophaga sp.]|nr:MAG: protein translocase subunit SecD [Methylophaga sp.]